MTEAQHQQTLSESILSEGRMAGTFTGWGSQRIVTLFANPEKSLSVIGDTDGHSVEVNEEQKKKNGNEGHGGAGLSVLNSVSIAGCDLLGSCLYTAGVCAFNSGKLAPLCLGLVTLMLFYFRLVYSEVVTALPVNGGTYNLLLNTTNKKAAAFVACLSLLSYTATAIVSAFDAVVYLAIIWPEVDVRGFTVLILVAFAAITLCGVKESSTVTLFLFSIHTITITILILWGFIYGCQDGFQLFGDNMQTPMPTILSSQSEILAERSVPASIYYGYASALLGITGFETASNYVEDLTSPQTFISTVNWMWLLVGVYNPILSLVSMMVLPMETIYDHPSDMLAEMAGELGGEGFKLFLCIDAVMILCGGVLTAIVGVTGLLARLAKDKVVPEELAAVSSWGSSYASIISFTIFCICLFLCIFDPTDPTGINRFGGVFAISFLSVLAAFAFAAILLKVYRPNLARLVVTEWWQVIFSFVAVFVGFIGNIILTPDVFVWFLVYLSGLLSLAGYMFLRVEILSVVIWMLRKINFDEKTKRIAARKDEEVIIAYQQQKDFEEFDFLMPRRDYDGHQLTPSSSPTKGHERRGSADWNNIQLPTRAYRLSFNEEEFQIEYPIRGRLVSYLTKTLDHIVNEPFAYFAKRPDPISLHVALEYITMNELSDSIYVIHFVDDRKYYQHLYPTTTTTVAVEEEADSAGIELLQQDVSDSNTNTNNDNNDYQPVLLGTKEDVMSGVQYEEIFLQRILQNNETVVEKEGRAIVGAIDPLNAAALPSEARQLVQYVSILDTFYTYKKISVVIVRGAHYCPSAVQAIASHLQLRLNDTIMGVPDAYFKFPFAKISGCRLVVQDASPALRRKVMQRLSDVIQSMSTTANASIAHL